MTLSGTVPAYDYSTTGPASPTVAAVTTSGLLPGATTPQSDEDLGTFFERAVGVLGTVSGGAATGVTIASGVISGLMFLQQELAAKAGQLKAHERSNQAVLDYSNALLTASGEVRLA